MTAVASYVILEILKSPYLRFLFQISKNVLFFRILCVTMVDSNVFFENFARKIDTRPAKNDPLAHALSLTAMFWRAAGEDLLTCPYPKFDSCVHI